uniref:Putative ionotropic receptor ligand binding domain-containing protein n=1 Tax=Stomoxys calcitrans TaxID=35570 RepID=A0A1I8NXZ8_STOCA
MDILKILFFLCGVLSLSGLQLKPQIWKVGFPKPPRTFEQAIMEYFESKTIRLSVAIHVDYTHWWKIFISSYLAEAFKERNSMKIEVFSDGKTRKYRLYEYNLWYVDSYKAFRALLPDFNNQFVETMGQYMVVMETAKHLNKSQELQQIVQKAFRRNIVNIAIAIYEGNFTFHLYHYGLFHSQKCRQVVLEQFNKFQYGQFTKGDLFPYKFHNFKQCPIDFYMRVAQPFFGYSLSNDHTKIENFWGLEAMILTTMADKLNFELHLEQTVQQAVGNVFENGTLVGPFKSLLEKKFDILMGYYHFPARSRYFAVSRSYFLTPTVVVIRKRGQDLVEGHWLLAPFHTNTWLVIIATMAFGMVTYHLMCSLVKPISSIQLTWLDVFGLTLGSARNIRSILLGTNMAICLWNLGFLIVCATFGGKLYDAFNRKPSMQQITIARLIALNYTFLTKNIYSNDLMRALQIPLQQIIYTDFVYDDDAFELLLQDPRPVALFANYWQFQAFVALHRLYDEFDMVPRVVVLNQICAYLRPQSYLIEPYNRILKSLQFGGILQKWMREITGYIGSPKEMQIVSRRKTNREPQQLSLAQLRIVFLGLIIANALNFAVFVGEVMVKRIHKKKS